MPAATTPRPTRTANRVDLTAGKSLAVASRTWARVATDRPSASGPAPLDDSSAGLAKGRERGDDSLAACSQVTEANATVGSSYSGYPNRTREGAERCRIPSDPWTKIDAWRTAGSSERRQSRGGCTPYNHYGSGRRSPEVSPWL